MITDKQNREEIAKRAERERQRDARLLAEYQRECEASWEGKTTNVRVV